MAAASVWWFHYLVLVSLLWATGKTDLSNKPSATSLHGKILTGPKKHHVLINKVVLTQKGYIQFLRYITHIPTIHDFTFCIWMRSSNLSHAHPLVSYSLHEEERLIRAWISPHGKTANLAIRENLVFKVPVNLKVNHWYHICQSWESKHGEWALFVNGKMKGTGLEPQIRGVKIPPRGDLVVGQEYTDFDKGLDDGIEGDIYGFNFVLAPATAHYPNPSHGFGEELHFRGDLEFNSDRRHSLMPKLNYRHQPVNIYVPDEDDRPQVEEDEAYYKNDEDREENLQGPKTSIVYVPGNSAVGKTEVPPVLGYFNTGANREPKGMDSFFGDIFSFLRPAQAPKFIGHPQTLLRTNHHIPQSYSHFSTSNVRHMIYHPVRATATRRVFSYPSKNFNEISGPSPKPLGLVLVEVGYHNCVLGKGAPIDDERVLISWTKTPVRVFGGAILKSVPAFCV